MNTNVKVIGLTRIVIKPKSTSPEANTFTTRPFELLVYAPFNISRYPPPQTGCSLFVNFRENDVIEARSTPTSSGFGDLQIKNYTSEVLRDQRPLKHTSSSPNVETICITLVD